MKRLGDSPKLLIVSRLCLAAMALLSAPILARALGPEGRGTLSALLAIGFLLPIALSAGTTSQVRRMYSRSLGHSVLRAARRWAWFGFAVAVPAGALVAWLIVGWTTSALFFCVGLFVASTPFTLLWMLDGSALVGSGRYARVMVVQVGPQLAYLITLGGLWFGQLLTLESVLLLNIGLNVLSAFLSHQSLGALKPVRAAPLRGLVRGSRRYWGASISEAASNRLDQVLVLPLMGAAQSGLYAVAVTIGTLPLALAQAIAAKTFRDVILRPEQSRRELLAVVSRASAIGGAMTSLLLAALVPFGIPILFGDAFNGAVLATLTYLVGSALAVVAAVQSSALTSLGRGWSVTAAQLCGVAVGLVALLAFAPSWGAFGAALASNVGFFTIVVILSIRLEIGPADLLIRKGDVQELRRLLAPDS